MKYTDKQIDDLYNDIYNGIVTQENLPEDLYLAIGDRLKSGLYEGYGASLKDLTLGTPDYELLKELRQNIYMFSGAKTYQQVREMADLVADSKTFTDFKQKVTPIYKQYNDDWLKAEYDTAIGQAQQARQWNDIQRDKDLYPYLRYNAVLDSKTSDICRPLDGVTLKVDDKFWDNYTPLNHFRCRCTLDKLDKYEDVETTPKSKVKDLEKELGDTVDDVFKMNAGKDKYVFSDEHPYFKVEPKDKGLAQKNFNLPIPEPTASKEVNDNVDKLLAGRKDFDTCKLFSKNDKFIESRLELHNNIVGDYLSEGSTKTGTSYFMGGAPATGKSSILETGVVKLPKNILVVDPDRIKATIPEYNEMVRRGENLAAHKVHEESSILSKDIIKNGLKKGYDLHVDAVGDGKYQSIVDKVEQQRAAGKAVEANYVYVNVEESVKRAKARAIKSGREVPENYIREMHYEISNLVPQLAKNGVFDKLKLWDNNVKFGEKPILIFEQNGANIVVHDKNRYKKFLKQGEKLTKKK